jgi:hypothetical protein
MQLQDLIKKLKKLPKNAMFKYGFSKPHSYRGIYSELALVKDDNVSVESMLETLMEAKDSVYEGYKGGQYTMNKHVDCYIVDDYDGYPGTLIDDYLFDIWIDNSISEEKL